MNSRDYWAMRSAQDMVDRMGTAEQTAAEMNKAIQRSADFIAKEVKAVFRGIESFGISEAEARKILNAAGDKTALQNLRAAAQRVSDLEKRQALISAIDSAGAYRYRITRLEQLNKDINARCRELYKTENRHITSALKTVAKDSYYHSIFNLQQATGLGFSFAQFSQKDVDRILRGNWLGGNYSQRIWKNVSATAESVKKELLISMLSGRSNEKTARIIRERFGVNAYCARRIVRTESAYVANAAQMSAYDEAGIEQYCFIATLDSKTSEVCAALDGKIFASKDAKPGTNYPPMHPWCRSTTIADFGDDELNDLERRAKDENGETVKVPADMRYDEWYRQFVDGGEKMGGEKMGGSQNDWTGAIPTKHTQDELNDLRRYADDRGIKLYSRRAFDGDIDLFKAEIDTIYRLRQEYKITDPIMVGWKPMSTEDFAETSKNHQKIWFNELALRNRTITEKNLSRDSWLFADKAEGIAAHEMGHIISGKIKKGKTGIDLFIETRYNVDKENISVGQARKELEMYVSDYAAAETTGKNITYREVVPEFISMHTTAPNAWSTEFVRLLKEAML